MTRLVAAMISVVAGCAGTLPAPTEGSHPARSYVEVPYPPPPARPEQVPEQPAGDAVWIDGEWAWQGRYWGWLYGRWVRPPAGARFAPSDCRYDGAGALSCAQGWWYADNGAELPHPRPVDPGGAGEGDVVDEQNRPVDVVPNRPAHSSR